MAIRPCPGNPRFDSPRVQSVGAVRLQAPHSDTQSPTATRVVSFIAAGVGADARRWAGAIAALPPGGSATTLGWARSGRDGPKARPAGDRAAVDWALLGDRS